MNPQILRGSSIQRQIININPQQAGFLSMSVNCQVLCLIPLCAIIDLCSFWQTEQNVCTMLVKKFLISDIFLTYHSLYLWNSKTEKFIIKAFKFCICTLVITQCREMFNNFRQIQILDSCLDLWTMLMLLNRAMQTIMHIKWCAH